MGTAPPPPLNPILIDFNRLKSLCIFCTINCKAFNNFRAYSNSNLTQFYNARLIPLPLIFSVHARPFNQFILPDVYSTSSLAPPPPPPHSYPPPTSYSNDTPFPTAQFTPLLINLAYVLSCSHVYPAPRGMVNGRWWGALV